MMKDEKKTAREIIETYNGPAIRIMEVCGTHTHEIFRLGIRSLLPDNIKLISGPGCPVCVTPVNFIDEAVFLAQKRQVTICTFGDLVRVPGTVGSLAKARSEGARVEVVYSPMDAYLYAEKHKTEQVVFLSVGFETTTPASCLAVRKAKQNHLENFSLLTANKTMPQAYQTLKGSADAFLYPGHVHAVMGTTSCEELVREGISGVITGFTAKEIVTALAVIIIKHREGKAFFKNCYPRVVTAAGSKAAQQVMEEVMEPCDAEWRGLGTILQSGLKLRAAYETFDARIKYTMPKLVGHSNTACRCGEVLQGKCYPDGCILFGKTCTPEHPVGACMVSHEGACSAFYQYGGIHHG
ncbi:hydrogenase formation protein HypD [Megasphaera paucivorans]|nr:hydrogenase formation protein HypD [Megasphaera paucivorans]